MKVLWRCKTLVSEANKTKQSAEEETLKKYTNTSKYTIITSYHLFTSIEHLNMGKVSEIKMCMQILCFS